MFKKLLDNSVALLLFLFHYASSLNSTAGPTAAGSITSLAAAQQPAGVVMPANAAQLQQLLSKAQVGWRRAFVILELGTFPWLLW